MTKKTRLSFSSLSKDSGTAERVENRAPLPRRSLGETDRKRPMKSSTYQYSKKRFGPRSGGRPFDQKRQSNVNEKILPPEKGVIRIIPLGGVEEIGKNMTAIEIGEDIVVIDAGMHFANEATPGVDYVIPNTTYLEERKEKIRALIITHGHLDHI